MTIVLRAAAGQLGAFALQALLEQVATAFQYMMLANVEERVFGRFNSAQVQDVAYWSEGVLFGPVAQLHWLAKGSHYRVSFLLEGQPLPAPMMALPHQECLTVTVEPLEIPLWGQHKPNDVDEAGQPFWLEAQVPRLLAYPVTGMPGKIALQVRRYSRQDGSAAFVRFVAPMAWS